MFLSGGEKINASQLLCSQGKWITSSGKERYAIIFSIQNPEDLNWFINKETYFNDSWQQLSFHNFPLAHQGGEGGTIGRTSGFGASSIWDILDLSQFSHIERTVS